MPRFVVLTHDAPDGRHWDLMFECAGVLKTWALERAPDDRPPIAARALADHRLHYLDYEGEVSAGRGRVSAWDRGRYEPLEQGAETWEVLLQGQRLSGRAALRRVGTGEDWEFTRPEETKT